MVINPKENSISKELGNASIIIYFGTQVIDWNISQKKYVQLENSSFASAKIRMKL